MEVDDEMRAILTEQRRELTAAQVAEADLQFALELQMQEAMTASLLPQDAAAASSSPSSNPAVSFTVNDPNIPDIFAEEITNCEQRLADHETAKAEWHKVQDDLNRRAHDRAFAREIMGVPEHQWREIGDNIEKPYGAASGSDLGNGYFRVYFKGLENGTGAGGGGIGVAICDESDALVFEVSKSMGFGEVVSDEVAEVKALIEGLNVAVMLGLKRVDVVCHSNPLYQYVTGKWRPVLTNVAALVDQVTLLQRKFTRCKASPMGKRDVKFALELARRALDSQVNRSMASICKTSTIEICAICLEATNIAHMFSIENCLHKYCFSCMAKHVEAKLLLGLLPKCPSEGCKSLLKVDSCKNFLTPEVYDLMIQRVLEASIPATEKVYCPNPRCSALMSKSGVQGRGRNAFAGAYTCFKCNGLFCITCKVPWHYNMTCFDYKRSNPNSSAEDVKLKNLASQNAWRQCVKCNHMVSLAEGCYHIYCRCGHEFCYTCGAEWRNKKATCTCPIWDEHNIIRNEH